MRIRVGTLPANTAIQDYDIGSLILVASGTPVQNIGNLYVNYRVILTVPQPNLNLNPSAVSLARQFLGDSSANTVSNLWTYTTDPAFAEYFREEGG